MRRAVSAAVVGRDERGGVEGGEVGLFAGVVLWKEENPLSSFHPPIPAAQHCVEVAPREGALLEAQRTSAVRLGGWGSGSAV